jgi:hypothetical protein
MTANYWPGYVPGMATWTYPLKSGDAAEVNMGTWIPCRIRTTLTTGNMVVGGPGYYVEYRTQNGDLVCQPIRKEYVRSPGDEYWDQH